MASAEKQVNDKIAQIKVVVIGKKGCPFTNKAKEVFKDMKASDYYEWDIDQADNMDDIQDYLKQLTGGRTVPRVFINGKFIGGGSEVEAMHKNGKLEEELRKKRADKNGATV